MACKLQPLQSGLFDQPSVELAPAQMEELAALVKVLLLEIATALVTGEVGDDQDNV